MLGFWNIIFSFILLALLYILIKAALKPDNFRVERSIEIKAPATKIFAHINNMMAWNTWSPWKAKEPEMSQSYNDISEGIGARMAWVGKKSGVGSMEIVKATLPTNVTFRLNFEKPFKAENQSEFTLREGNGITIIIWAMTGKSNFISKLMDVLMNMDRMIGKDFEDGLNNLKRISEA